jgi:autotransporter-associated beta strand protein
MKTNTHAIPPTQVPAGGRPLSSAIRPLLAAALIFCGGGASGLQLAWDAGSNGTNNGPNVIPGSGNWDTSSLNWNNGTTDVVWGQISGTAGSNVAIFGGADGAYSITNVVQVSATNVYINNSGYTFYGQPLDVVSGSNLVIAAGKTVTFNCNLAADNNAKNYIAGAGAVVNIAGNILGQQAKLIGANAAYYLSGINTPTVLYNLAPVFLTNGSITTSSSFFVGYNATVDGTVYNTGSLTISGGATATQVGNVLMVGRGGGNGTLTLINGAINAGLTAAHDLAICYDGNAGELGTLNVYGGTVTVGSSSFASKLDFFDTAGSGAGAAAVMTQTNGVVNAWGGVIFGAASGTFTGGSAALTNSGGFLYVGSGGINRAAGFPPSISVSLSGGTVAALASWSSTLPMTLATLNGNITFQCADSSGTPWNISLAGPLTGAGGLYVTGSGTLTLSGTNNYAGTTVVSNGTLAVVTGAFPTNGPVTADGSAGSPTISARGVEPGTILVHGRADLHQRRGDGGFPIRFAYAQHVGRRHSSQRQSGFRHDAECDCGRHGPGCGNLSAHSIHGDALRHGAVQRDFARLRLGLHHEHARHQDDCLGRDEFHFQPRLHLGGRQWRLGHHHSELEAVWLAHQFFQWRRGAVR